MDADDRLVTLAATLRTLADPARLRILGALAEGTMTGTELAERLGLTAPTISHHMAKLVAAGVVSVTPDAQRRRYALDAWALRDLGRDGSSVGARAGDVSARATSQADASPEAAAERERTKVLRDFFDGSRLRSIPAGRRKRVIVLRHLLERFAPGRDYPEREVNDLLREAHEDVATLRRELVDYGYMTREAGVYRVAESLPERTPTIAQEILGDEHAWLSGLIAGAAHRALADSPTGPMETP